MAPALKRLDGGQFSLLGAGPWSFISQDVPQEDKQTTVAADRSNKQRPPKASGTKRTRAHTTNKMPCESNFQASIEVKTPENTSRYTLRKEVPSGQRQDDLAVVRSGKLVLDVGEPSQKPPDPHHKGSLVDLHCAAYGGSIECVKYLLPCFEDKDKKFPVDENGWTCLHHAVAGGSDPVVKYLMNNGGFDLDQRTGDGLTPLMLAAQFGSLSVAKLLVETYKCDVNEESAKMSSTPMMFAAQYGHRPIVELLVNHGADVFQKAHGSLVALHHAAYGGSLECVKYLMPLFGDRKFEADENGLTCLHWAVLGGNLTVVRYLVDQWEFDLRLRTAGRLDCFLLACEEGHREIVRELLKRDEVDRNAVDEDGYGALHLAKKGGHAELVQMLVQEFGFPPDTSNNVSSLQAEGGSDPSEREDTSNLLTDEAAVKRLCWIPFDIKTVSIEAKGGILLLEPQSDDLQEMKEDTIFVEVPPDAVSTATNVEMRYAIIPSGPFTLPKGYQFGSPVVYIYYDGRYVTKPLALHLPHWYGGEHHASDGLSFAVASHSLEGRRVHHFELLAGGKFPVTSRCGVIEIGGHCSLFTVAFKDGATVNYQAFSLVKENEGETECKAECSIAVTNAVYCWRKILLQNRPGWEVSQPNLFQFKSDRITATLKEKSHVHGDWRAYLTGASELLSSHVRYDVFGIHCEHSLEEAVKDYAYPPAIKYIVKYRKELRRTGRSTEVILQLHISDTDQPMDFPYTAYERIQGTAPTHPEGVAQTETNPAAATFAQVIQDRTEEFLQEMNAKEIAPKLKECKLIPESVEFGILQSKTKELANICLLRHLKEDADEEAAMEVFRIATEMTGYGKMNTFAAGVLRKLRGESSLKKRPTECTQQDQPPAKRVVRSEGSVGAVVVSSSATGLSRRAVAAERGICEATMHPWNKDALKSMRQELGRVDMNVVMIKKLEKSDVPSRANLGFLSREQLQVVESMTTPAGQMNKVIEYLVEMEDKYFEDFCTVLEQSNFEGKAERLREKAEVLKRFVDAQEAARIAALSPPPGDDSNDDSP